MPMQEVLHQTLVEILPTLEAVTAELHHHHHKDAMQDVHVKGCTAESCQALSGAQAQVEDLRRALGEAAFRTR